MSRKPKVAQLALAAAAALLFSGLLASPAHAATATPVKNFGNRKCVDVQTQSNYWVQLWSCNGQSQQNWTQSWQSDGLHLVNQRNNRCLGNDYLYVQAGQQILTTSCTGSESAWNIVYTNNFGTGWHQQLEFGDTHLCLDLLDNRSTNGTPLQLWWCWTSDQEDNPAQLWML